MKCMCVVSSAPGHIDLGGMGFVRLCRALARRGHQARWVTTPRQAHRLEALGFSCLVYPAVEGIGYRLPVVPGHEIEISVKRKVLHVKSFAHLLQEHRPDLVLFDRTCVFGAFAADALGVPYVAVGTPGGDWYKDAAGVFPADAPVEASPSLNHQVAQDLNWAGTATVSCWVNSPYLNVSFLGQDFYQDGRRAATVPNAFVHLYAQDRESGSRHRIGLSFGHSGDVRFMQRLLARLIDEGGEEQIVVFAGGRPGLFEEVKRQGGGRCVHVLEWVDFDDHFGSLKWLAFFGGVGTIWHCVNRTVPMFVLPGSCGDQAYNGRRVEQLGLGIGPTGAEEACDGIGAVAERLKGMRDIREQLESSKARVNFTDTLDSVCDRIEGLVR